MELRYDPLTDHTRLEQAFSDYENGRKNYHFHELPPLPEDDAQIPLTKKKSRHAKAWSDIAWEQFQEWQCRDRKTLHRLQQKIVRERRIPFIIEAPPIPTDIVQFLHRIVLCYFHHITFLFGRFLRYIKAVRRARLPCTSLRRFGRSPPVLMPS